MRIPSLLLIAGSLVCGLLTAQGPLINPLLPSGADPWVIMHDGFYYYMNTTGNSLAIRRVRNMADLGNSEATVVWRPPSSGPYSRDIWAPELHFVHGKWYIYFAADAGTNASHRIWVLENDSSDPRFGEWRMKGKVADATDRWAIDATVFEQNSRLYMIWSGWEGEVNGAQNLYIAELENPWTVKGARVRLSTPEFPWEKVGDLKPRREAEENPGANRFDPVHVDVNEGPEVLRHGNRIFLIYSAGGCWTDFYSLGMLSAPADSDLLNPASWNKSALPVFWQSPKAGAFGPGHGSFFQSADGKEDWMLYHANPQTGQGCGRQRSPRAQRFTWTAEGMPDFGRPAPVGVEMARPGGQ